MQPTRRTAVVAGSVAVVALALATVVLLIRFPYDDGPVEILTSPQAEPGPTRFRVASFNVLAAWHTEPRGTRPSMASGEQRIALTLRLLDDHGVGVAGLQEVQRRQYAELERRGDQEWDGHPGLSLRPQDSHNSIIWRTAQWRAVERRTVGVPYFRGRIDQMPYVLLRHVRTGQEVWFVNVHNPADGRFRGNHAAERAEATRIQADLVNRLRAAGDFRTPVVLTGDMNERETYYCRLTARTAMKAANGGSVGGPGCDPPAEARIDWIFGSRELRFGGYRAVVSPLVERASDHPLVLADVTVPSP